MQAFWRAAAACWLALVAGTATAQMRDSIPSQLYYTGIRELYDGNYRDAERIFLREIRGAVKTLGPNGYVFWIDSICYHAMLGETYYQAGQLDKALTEFNYAASAYLDYPQWMMQVDFRQMAALRPDPALVRSQPAWGTSGRRFVPGKFPSSYAIAFGQLDNSAVVRNGGVLQQAQYWQVNVVEIQRATSLTIRRRNELLGPLGAHDAISKRLVAQLSRGGTPANHWSAAWVLVNRGLAHAGIGDTRQALDALSRGLVIADEFDHPLTCVSLLEQGRLAMDAGGADAAADLFAEAGFSAFLYGDAGVLDDAFRWGQQNRFAAGAEPPNPALPIAAEWARRQDLRHVAARLHLLVGEELAALHNFAGAQAALAAGQSLMGDGRRGVLGNEAAYLAAVIECMNGRPSGLEKLAAAVAAYRNVSMTNYQITLADSMFDAQTLPARSAVLVYRTLLSDPTVAAAVGRPLETMTAMAAPHDAAFDRWLAAALDRNDFATALEVTDRAKRRRFHAVQPMAGRLAAVRDLLCSPLDSLTPQHQQQRSYLLARLPDFAATLADVDQAHSQLSDAWKTEPTTKEEVRALDKLWDEYSAGIDARESALERVALERAPVDISFPPITPTTDIRGLLREGQTLVVFHETSAGVFGFLMSPDAQTAWDCGPSGDLEKLVGKVLRDLGNFDAAHKMTPEELKSDAWRQSTSELFGALFAGSGLDLSATTELVIVPDGITWYAPFEAMWVDVDGRTAPMIQHTPIRYAPTAALAVDFHGPWRRVQRTGVVVGDDAAKEMARNAKKGVATLPADSPVAALMARLENPLILNRDLAPAPPVIASELDALVVLDDVETEEGDPLGWAPLTLGRSDDRGTLAEWLTLARTGPQRLILPAMHTLAERGGKASRRRGVDAPLGDELFFAGCSLMSAGCETMLLSRWRVGGQSTLEMVGEFAKEAPFSSAAVAWQRAVEVGMETPVDPTNEFRVEPPKPGESADLTAAHPFFWAGYLVIDSGWSPADDPEAPQEQTIPAAAPAGVPGVLPPVPADASKKDANEAAGAQNGKDAAKTPEVVPPPPKPPGAAK